MISLRKLACAASVALISIGATPSQNAYDSALVLPYGRPQEGGQTWSASRIERLHKDIDRILGQKALRGAHIGLNVVSAQDRTMLYDRNADEEFMPASNFKLLTGSAALQKFGPDYVFRTRIAYDGTNIYLRGGGNSLLRASDLDAAAAQIAASGLTSVSGSVVVDASHFDSQRYANGWSWDDLPYYYAPAISALGIEDHVLHVFMRPGPQLGAPVLLRIEPETDAVVIDNRMTTGPAGSRDTSEIVRSFDDWNTIILTGSYPLGEKESGDLVPAVPDPARYAGDVLLRALRAHGIATTGTVQSGKTPDNARILWTHASAPMRELLADFWWPSDNLLGEIFLKELGSISNGTVGTDEGGTAVEQSYLRTIGVDPATVEISDGSGLSQYDRITPHDLVQILQSDWKSPQRDIVLDALPLSGVRGSLKSFFKGTPAEKNVFAKTGSVSKVRTISGFLRTKHHGTVIFSFMLDDWFEDVPALTKIRSDLFNRIITD